MSLVPADYGKNRSKIMIWNLLEQIPLVTRHNSTEVWWQTSIYFTVFCIYLCGWICYASKSYRKKFSRF
jgi:hypothetical protein